MKPLSEEVLRRYVGGVGLGAWLVARETPAGASPLGPEASVVFALSPLVGSPLTTSAKFAVMAISPLTGRFCDALSSSHFALAAKRSGVDALAIVGTRSEPSVLLVDGQGRAVPAISWHSAGAVWGRAAAEAEKALRERFGTEWQFVSIGPAGERLIPFATISHDGRHAGRGGLGAILGAKRIKAIGVRGDRRTPLADVKQTLEMARDLSVRSLGPATEKYRAIGTVANLLVFNRLEALPTRNFQSGHFEGAEKLAVEDLGPARRVARQSCAACTIGCEHIFARPGGGSGVRIEYESLFAFGPLCGVEDPEQVVRAAAFCDEMGIDTISAGGTLAFLMECGARGLIDPRLPDSGRALAFGDGEALLEALGLMVRREGELGRLLSLGSRGASLEIGGEALELAPHVKGLELPGYNPRTMPAMALGLAVGTRGADHNRSGAYEVDFSGIARDVESTARLVIAAEDRSALLDSMILCKFLRGVFENLYMESARMLQAVTGWDVEEGELREVSRRIVTVRKAINQREGWTRAEDALPSRLFDSSVGGGLDRDRLEALIDSYYRARGWTPEGRVPPDLLHEVLGADEEMAGRLAGENLEEGAE